MRLYVADLIAPKDSLILPSLYHIHAGIYTANELENRCAFLETPVKQLVLQPSFLRRLQFRGIDHLRDMEQVSSACSKL